MPSTVAEVRGDVVAEGLPDRTEPPRRAAGESATRLCPCMDRRATFVAPAHALAEPLFPARPERRSALMAPIPRLLADGDMSLFDLPLGDLRPWMADRRLSHGIAMACRPRSHSRCADPWFGVMHRVAVRGARPPHLRPLWHAERSCRCASRLLLRAGTGGGMDGMRAQRQVALRGLTAPTHRRPRSSGRAGLPAQALQPVWPPTRPLAGPHSTDGRPPTTPASREVAFCTLPPR
jgi:hypothetical protein